MNLNLLNVVSYEINYGLLLIKQQWIIIYSKEARERSRHTLKKQFDKQNQKDLQLIQKFEKEEFACESDMNKALNIISKKLKSIEIIKQSIVKRGCYKKAGRPSKHSEKEYDYYRYSSTFTLASSLQSFYDKLHQKSHFILATNDLTLEPKDIFDNYKNQHIVERGFRFLKGKEFLSDAIYIKSPERIEALLFIMTLSLMVYAALEYRIRKELSNTNSTIPDQKGKPTSTPTTRWIFHCFIGIQMLIINDTQQVMMNLNDVHKLIIRLLGGRYLDIYLIAEEV
ncbi:MAG: IS1634 family transposase [Campylobacterota bacterium]|nr:IS1634 family transposase [Campylobacterota bacterium]